MSLATYAAKLPTVTEIRSETVRTMVWTTTCPRCGQPIFPGESYLSREVTNPVRRVRTHLSCPDRQLWGRRVLTEEDHWGVVCEVTRTEAGLSRRFAQLMYRPRFEVLGPYRRTREGGL